MACRGMRFVLFGLIGIGPSVLVDAQNSTGGIDGIVLDPSHAVVRNASITITEGSTGWTVNLLTNELGRYTAVNLSPGVYSIVVKAHGFATGVLKNLVVASGAVYEGAITLELGRVEEAIEVKSSAVTVDLVRHVVDTVVTEEQIHNLPLTSRNALDLAILAPGVQVSGATALDPTKAQGYRAIGISGRFGAGTPIQVDGVQINDFLVGSTMINLSPDAVHEFQLTRSSLDVSGAMTSTGAVSINLKSGSNQVHGRSFIDYSGNSLTARQGYAATLPAFRQDREGISAGGPFVRNKLFWFGGWERLSREDTLQQVNSTWPQLNATRKIPGFSRYFNAHADWNARPGMHAFYGLLNESNLSIAGSLAQPYRNTNWATMHTTGVDLAGTHWSHSFRFGFVNFNNRLQSVEFGIRAPLTPQGQPYLLSVGTYSAGPNANAPQSTGESSIQNSYDGGWFHGSHTLRFGGHVNVITSAASVGPGALGVAGSYNAAFAAQVQASGGDTQDPLEYPLASIYIPATRLYPFSENGHGFPYGAHHDTRWSGDAADSIRALRRLTINLGVRWEYDTGYFANNRQVARDPVLDRWAPGASKFPVMPKDLFSPSLGFAWDLTGRGRTVIRGGFTQAYESSIHENSDESAMLPPSYGGTAFSLAFVAGPDGRPINSDGRHPNGSYQDLQGQRIGDVIGTIGQLYQAVQTAFASVHLDPRGPSAFSLTQGQTTSVYPGNQYRMPYSLQFNVGVQRELAQGTVLTADYVYLHGVGLPLLKPDLERRMDAETLDGAAARARINSVLAGKTMDDWIAANPTATISAFGIMTDAVWTGLSRDFLSAKFVEGGFTRYSALQISVKGNRGHVGPLRNVYYDFGYALSRSEASDTSTIPELVYATSVRDNRNWNSRDAFGPTSIDQTHRLTAATNLSVPGGFLLGSIWTFRTTPALSIPLPVLTRALPGLNGLFGTDRNGDGITDLLPGLGAGQFGRRVKGLAEMNDVIRAFNQTYSGTLSAHAQALVKAGLFTEPQLKTLGAVISPIPLVPENNPNPWHNVFTTSLLLERPVRLERFYINPFAQVSNLFNHAPAGVYSGLTNTFGSLNFDYSKAPSGFQASDLNASRGRNTGTRFLQVGVRVSF